MTNLNNLMLVRRQVLKRDQIQTDVKVMISAQSPITKALLIKDRQVANSHEKQNLIFSPKRSEFKINQYLSSTRLISKSILISLKMETSTCFRPLKTIIFEQSQSLQRVTKNETRI